METALSLLFLPFVYFIFWGPIAFFCATRMLVRRLCMRYQPVGTAWRSFVVLMCLFLPVAVTGSGANVAVVVPWWLAALGIWLPTPAGLEFSATSVIPAVLVAPLAMWLIEREVRREKANEKERDGGTAV